MKDVKRFTIGVLASGILDEFTKTTCKGIIREAQKADVDVIVFPGKFLQRDLSANPEIRYEYQYNTLFRYPTLENVDALIIAAGSLGCFATEKYMREWLKYYQRIPCVLIAFDINGYVSVNYDNYQGIKDGLEFMIKHSKCRHFGMIGGNQDNTDGKERKESFYQVLHDNGFKDEDIVYVEGDFTRRCKRAYCELLDNHPEVDAVFCTNDDTAVGFYEEVKRRGLRIGKDISILGYDDTIEAANLVPPLSTVRADSWKLGEEALKIAVDMLSGKEVEKCRKISTSFVRRGSIYTEAEDVKTGNEVQNIKFESIFYRFMHEEMADEIQYVKGVYDKLYAVYSRIIAQNKSGISDYAELLSYLDEFVSSGAMEYADVDRILGILQRAYAARMVGDNTDSKMQMMDLFFMLSNKLSYALNQQLGKSQKESEYERHEMKLFVQKLLQFEKGTDASYGSLLKNVGWLGISDAAVYTFPKSCIHLDNEEFIPPKELKLKAVMSEGQTKVLSAYEQRVKLDDIFRNEHYSSLKRTDRVVLPLFDNEILYGMMVCNLSEQIYVYGEFLINQLSSAVKVIDLLHTNETIQIQLEENLRMLKENNVKLDTISKSDPLTGILNRRGFYEEGQNVLDKLKGLGKDALVIYVDMNNLKIINDRYGHKEGDESLKMIGQILQELVEGRGIAGRIGGDEYACIMEYSAAGKPSNHVTRRIYGCFEKYNESSDKPYNLTVSAGGYLITADDKLGLNEALQKADEKLYVEKLKRKKEVAK